MQIEIPGGVAVIRDKVTIGGRMALERTLPAALGGIRKIQRRGLPVDNDTPVATLELTEAELEGFQRFQAAAVVAFLQTWTIDEVVPRTIDEALEMDPDVYVPLAKAVSPLALGAIKRPDVGVDSSIGPDGKRDPDSPTGPSTGSQSGWAATPSTPTPSDASTPSSGSATSNGDTVASSD